MLERSLLGLEKELAAGGREMISIDKLRTVDIFQGLTDGELKIVSQFFQEENMEKGVTLFQEGEEADRLVFLRRGPFLSCLRRLKNMTCTCPGELSGGLS